MSAEAADPGTVVVVVQPGWQVPTGSGRRAQTGERVLTDAATARRWIACGAARALDDVPREEP